MEGLEASILSLSKVGEENDVLRLDSLYFLRSDIVSLEKLLCQEHERLGDTCYVTDGIHTSIDFKEGSGIKVISAKHPKEGYFDLSSVEEISAASHAANPRTALRQDDVLISTVGTIGNVAVVREEMLPANSDRHVAIIRPQQDKRRPLSSEYLTTFLLSRYGRMQSQRETTGNVQPNLFLIKIRDFKVARYSDQFESRIHAFSVQALSESRSATDKQKEAEDTLLEALVLADWGPPEPLSYTARANDAFAAGRIDAQYFMPAKEKVRRSLAAMPGSSLGERMDSIRDMFVPNRVPTTMKLRNYDVTDALVPLLDAEKETSFAAEIGSIKKTFKDGDVAISRLRAYLKEIAVVRRCDDIPSVGSSEFIVLRPKNGQSDISPETLMVFLRSAPVQTILKWCQDGSQHPRFSERDLLSIPVPDAVAEVSEQITTIVKEGFAARHQACQLLEVAKHAVEIAIENGEAAAMDFLDQTEGLS